MTFRRKGAFAAPGRAGGGLGALWERSRLEWRIPDGGDPAGMLADFLADQGIDVRDLAAGDRRRSGRRAGKPAAAYGATLFLSAAASAHLAGAPTGAPSPAPAVPDLVAVAWEPPDRAPDPAAARATGRARSAGPGDGQRPEPPWWVGTWRPSWSPAAHAAAVETVRAAIARGDVYQVNLVGHAAAPYQGDPGPALDRVAGLPGASYAGVLSGAGWALACASPETLVRVAAGRVATSPIKGTRAATAAGRAELLASPKERAEHIMIVDLERNDLARVARTGSVRVEQLYAVRRWCDLWQAESVVTAALADGVGLVELLRATAPGGSVTGAPKLAALEQIAAIEPVGRGASMGALGWIGHGELDLGLTIRTVAVDPEQIHLWAGGGITWGSDPAAEVAEAAAKAAPLVAALAPRPPDRQAGTRAGAAVGSGT